MASSIELAARLSTVVSVQHDMLAVIVQSLDDQLKRAIDAFPGTHRSPGGRLPWNRFRGRRRELELLQIVRLARTTGPNSLRSL